MSCTSPLKGWRSKELTANGKRKIVFNAKDAYLDMPITLPCGQCLSCRLERSREWAIRCIHEASLHDENCFLTLTYDEENIPENKSLDLPEVQRFFKRLRKRVGTKISYFHCGEYGDMLGRPHYHICLFGYRPGDCRLQTIHRGNRLYISDTIRDLWPLGNHIIGDLTFQSAAYTARYIMKKITGKKAEEHYDGRKPEYVTMSRNPGIGKGWIEHYALNVLHDDKIIINGKVHRPPRYYDEFCKIEYPDEQMMIAYQREKALEKAVKNGEQKDHRLMAKDTVARVRAKLLKRGFEDEKDL